MKPQPLRNIAAVLAAAGSDFSKIVRLNVYLKSYADFVPMDKVCGSLWRGEACKFMIYTILLISID
jgi:enamine deaminase RidA (YjgF/YER057c/UK114 family)